MISPALVERADRIRDTLVKAVDQLEQMKGFQTLLRGSEQTELTWRSVLDLSAAERLRQPFTRKFVCAIIGGSSHGKTTILAEMFPDLAKRGWLVTETSDTTAQALRIDHANASSPDRERIIVHSWTFDQVKRLLSRPDVRAQNASDQIEVNFLDQEQRIEVNGDATRLKDAGKFKFAKRLDLRPFPHPYVVPPDLAGNEDFQRALTIKDLPAKLSTSPLIVIDNRAYNSLQLRTVVKDVTLHDSFDRIKAWANLSEEEAACLVWLDSPGLATEGSAKDEVMRHALEKKSNQIALELWRADELDVVVHLVLCSRQSNFASLWKDVEAECGPGAMESLAERLIVAINGTNIYFGDSNISRKWKNADVARREGDQFATTLEDNILQKLSPRGKVKPARIVFLDSKNFLDSRGWLSPKYDKVYAEAGKIMESWLRPEGVGYQTLSRLGLLESFRTNIQALCDPQDCGQGFLVRQVVGLIREKGPALFLKKTLLRSELLDSVQKVRRLLHRYFDKDGKYNFQRVQDAVKKCLRFLVAEDGSYTALQEFAQKQLEPQVDQVVEAFRRSAASDWPLQAFWQTCARILDAIKKRAEASGAKGAVWDTFASFYKESTETWGRRWGYATLQLPPQSDRSSSLDLVKHCLKVHCQEVLYSLLTDNADAGVSLTQSAEEQALVRNLMQGLEEAENGATALLQEHGVPIHGA